MQYQKLEQYISKPRLDRFLISCSNSQERAEKLYSANLKVSQAFYPILNLLETFLRNSINNNLSNYFNDSNWIITQKTGFMNDSSLATQYWLKKQVEKAERNTRGTITPGKIIAEQTFGFWTALFEPHHYRLFGGHIIHCFPNKPAHINRNQIAGILKDIRKFRNRIYHNESICFDNITIDFSNAESIKQRVYDLFDWMDSDMRNFVAQNDSIDQAISEAYTI